MEGHRALNFAKESTHSISCAPLQRNRGRCELTDSEIPILAIASVLMLPPPTRRSSNLSRGLRRYFRGEISAMGFPLGTAVMKTDRIRFHGSQDVYRAATVCRSPEDSSKTDES